MSTPQSRTQGTCVCSDTQVCVPLSVSCIHNGKLHSQFACKTGNMLTGNAFLKNGPNPASFCFFFVLFSHCKYKYSTNWTLNYKSIDGVLRSKTRCSRMEGADKSTELWWHPKILFCPKQYNILTYDYRFTRQFQNPR